MTPRLPNPNLDRSKARLRLYCLPYAGGAASIFRHWHKSLPASVEVCPLELPGRGRRRSETAASSLEGLVQAAADELKSPHDRPFALFGHSMGALVAFELSRLLRREQGPAACCLLVSGFRAPSLPDPNPALAELPDAELIEELGRLKGTPQEILASRELMELVLPVLRADFGATESYRHRSEAPLDCPIRAYGALNDSRTSRVELEGWRQQSSAGFRLRMFSGDHFFLHERQDQLLAAIGSDLKSVCASDDTA